MADSRNVQQGKDFLFYDALYSSSNAMPPDSDYGTYWGPPYRDIGYTDGGIGFNIGTTYNDVRVDQEIDLVGVIPASRDIRATAQLAEFTLTNIQAAVGQGTLTSVAATAGVRGHTDLSVANTIAVTYRTVGFDVLRSLGDGQAFRGVIWRGQCRSSVQTSFQSGQKSILPFEIQAFPDPANSQRVLTLRDISPAL